MDTKESGNEWALFAFHYWVSYSERCGSPWPAAEPQLFGQLYVVVTVFVNVFSVYFKLRRLCVALWIISISWRTKEQPAEKKRSPPWLRHPARVSACELATYPMWVLLLLSTFSTPFLVYLFLFIQEGRNDSTQCVSWGYLQECKWLKQLTQHLPVRVWRTIQETCITESSVHVAGSDTTDTPPSLPHVFITYVVSGGAVWVLWVVWASGDTSRNFQSRGSSFTTSGDTWLMQDVNILCMFILDSRLLSITWK